jgi:hypothetical protein
MRFVVVMVLVQLMGAVPVAQAAGSEDGASAEENKVAARAEWRQANVAYNLGHYDEAAKHFEAAYTLIQDSAFLFNIAQSYRMGGKLDQALDRYRAFLRTSRADAPNRDTAERLMAEIKRKLDEKPAPIAPPEAAPAKEAAPAVPALAPPPVPAETTAAGPSSAAPAPAAPVPIAPAAPIAIPVPPPPESATTLTTAPAAPEPASAGQPIYKTWWFWTGVGAVVVAGTVTAILFAYHPSNSACSGAGLPSCVEVR